MIWLNVLKILSGFHQSIQVHHAFYSQNSFMASLLQNMSDITSVSPWWRVFARVEQNICTGVELQTSGPGLTRTENLSAAVKNKSSGDWKIYPDPDKHSKRAQMLPQCEQGLNFGRHLFMHTGKMLFYSHVTIKMWMCRTLSPGVLTGHAKITTVNREKCSHFLVTWTSHQALSPGRHMQNKQKRKSPLSADH